MHRDLKLENLMFHNVRKEVKIIDFGFSKKLDSEEAKTGTVLGT